jgi:hypothetical protein
MNPGSFIFCQIDEADLKRDSTVAIFATVADYRVKAAILHKKRHEGSSPEPFC